MGGSFVDDNSVRPVVSYLSRSGCSQHLLEAIEQIERLTRGELVRPHRFQLIDYRMALGCHGHRGRAGFTSGDRGGALQLVQFVTGLLDHRFRYPPPVRQLAGRRSGWPPPPAPRA